MSGLNSLLTGTTTQSTTMPTWYDTAQQNTLTNAGTATSAMPSFNNTVGGVAVNNLSNPNTNPFGNAQNNLQQIATGAINPWLTNSTTGAVTPNTNTAMGGLFAAQDQQLKGLIPQTVAPANAGAIANGQFGSLSGDTAADTALTNAQNTLTAQQMSTALQNQQTGVNASTGLGNVGAQGTQAETTLGQIQQNAPMQSVADYDAILSSLKPPESTTQSYTLPLAAQISGLGGLVNSAGVLTSAGTNLINNLGLGSGSNAGYGGSTIPGTPTDTSGASNGTFPNILGNNTTGNTDTGVYSPIDTTGGGVSSGAGIGTPGQSSYYTGGGYARGGLVFPAGLI